MNKVWLTDLAPSSAENEESIIVSPLFSETCPIMEKVKASLPWKAALRPSILCPEVCKWKNIKICFGKMTHKKKKKKQSWRILTLGKHTLWLLWSLEVPEEKSNDIIHNCKQNAEWLEGGFWGAYLWQGTVELMNSVHYIQQHVVADHQLRLWSTTTCYLKAKWNATRRFSSGQAGSEVDSQIWRLRGRPWKNRPRRSAPPVGLAFNHPSSHTHQIIRFLPRKALNPSQANLLLLQFLLFPSFSLVVIHFADLDVTLLLRAHRGQINI